MNGVATLGSLGFSMPQLNQLMQMDFFKNLSPEQQAQLSLGMINMDQNFTQNQGFGMQDLGSLLGGVSSLAGMFMGFKQLGIMEDYLGIAKEQWAKTKEEMERISGVRQKLNSQYTGSGSSDSDSNSLATSSATMNPETQQRKASTLASM